MLQTTYAQQKLPYGMVDAVVVLVVAGIVVIGRPLHRSVYKTFQLVNGLKMINLVTIKLISMKVWVSFS
jgi:hypothetical protein